MIPSLQRSQELVHCKLRQKFFIAAKTNFTLVSNFAPEIRHKVMCLVFIQNLTGTKRKTQPLMWQIVAQQGESSGGGGELIIFIIHHLLFFDCLFLLLCLIPSCLTLPHSTDVLSTCTLPFTISFLLFIRLCHMFCCLPAFFCPLPLNRRVSSRSPSLYCTGLCVRWEQVTPQVAGWSHCVTLAQIHIELVWDAAALLKAPSNLVCATWTKAELRGRKCVYSVLLALHLCVLFVSQNGRCREEFVYSLKL